MQPNRDFLLKYLAEKHPSAIAVEIGVAHGNFSQRILQKASVKRLYLCDPWKYDPSAEEINRFYGGKAGSQEKMDAIYESVEQRFADEEKVEIRRKRSDEFLVETVPEFFNWIYIDGNHDFASCITDILLSISKVKIGGTICGDDVKWGREHNFPVEKAVQTIIKNEKRLKLIHVVKNKPFQNGQFVFERVK